MEYINGPILVITPWPVSYVLRNGWLKLAAENPCPLRKVMLFMENTVSLSILSAPLHWDAALDNLVERIDRAIPELGLLTDRQGIIAMTDINGLPCKWPYCNFGFGFARTMEQP